MPTYNFNSKTERGHGPPHINRHEVLEKLAIAMVVGGSDGADAGCDGPKVKIYGAAIKTIDNDTLVKMYSGVLSNGRIFQRCRGSLV